MLLYIMRHGPAEDVARSGRDFDRALTVKGRERVRRMAAELVSVRRAGIARIVTSPLVRARETAGLVLEVAGAGADATVEVAAALASGQLLPMALVRTVASSELDTLLVGHQPIVAELVHVLARDGRHLPGFRTAAIACLSTEEDGGFRFEQMLEPAG